jgi:hypothetical protein
VALEHRRDSRRELGELGVRVLLEPGRELPDRDLVLEHVGLHRRELVPPRGTDRRRRALQRFRVGLERVAVLLAEGGEERLAVAVQPCRSLGVLVALVTVAALAAELVELAGQRLEQRLELFPELPLHRSAALVEEGSPIDRLGCARHAISSLQVAAIRGAMLWCNATWAPHCAWAAPRTGDRR